MLIRQSDYSDYSDYNNKSLSFRKLHLRIISVLIGLYNSCRKIGSIVL